MIKIDDYLIEICKYSGQYDLYRTGITQKGKNAGKETRSALGYSMDMERTIERIIQDKLRREIKVPEELNTFIESYKKVSEDVLNKLNKEIEKLNK